MKTLVAFKSAANANPKLKQRYVDQLKSLYEQESGESIDELKEGARSNQKSLQTQADYSTPANVNGKGGGVSDMFEDMD